jgi:hypothetical protein
MRNIQSLAAALLAATSLSLGGCHTLSQYPDQPPITTGGSVETSRVRFHVVASLEALQAKCMNHNPGLVFYACAYPQIDPIDPKRSVCTVFVLEPRGVEDGAMIAILGHEVWHCFGARHLEVQAAAWRR